MELAIYFSRLLFPDSVLRRATSAMSQLEGATGKDYYYILQVVQQDETWSFDDPEDFYARYADAKSTHIHYKMELKKDKTCLLSISTSDYGTKVAVSSAALNDINTVMNVFRNARDQAKHIVSEAVLDSNDSEVSQKFNIFIGHGRSNVWRQLSDHLRDKHGLSIVAYENGARAGHTIRDILDEMLDNSSLAFLVYTGEDETAEEKMRARQNVVHETGLFQGRLGFSKVIMLLEEGVEQFSNLAGIQYIPFNKGHIDGTFGDVLATIRREQSRRINDH